MHPKEKSYYFYPEIMRSYLLLQIQQSVQHYKPLNNRSQNNSHHEKCAMKLMPLLVLHFNGLDFLHRHLQKKMKQCHTMMYRQNDS